MALAYELKDNIPLAEEWLNAAYKLAESYGNNDELKMIRDYQKALEKRLKDIRKLNQTQNE
jgi:tellurite resistance protein